MKKKFYLCPFLLISVALFAQSPGGITGSVLWLKANTGASPSAWADNSGLANNFSQPSTVNQPVLASNVFNFNAALQFDGMNTYMAQPTPTSFPQADENRSIFVVANATATNSFRWIFSYGTTSGSSTCQVGNINAGLSNAFYGVDITTPNYWNAPANANGALASFTLNSSVGSQFDRGNLLQQITFVPLFATSINGVIGALTTTPNELWQGSIAEVIMFNSSLSYTARNQVESYLALKYGFTLDSTGNHLNYVASDGTTVYWTGSATYQHDIFGIGTDNGSALTQLQSNSMNSGNGDGSGQNAKGNLILSTGTALADKQFLLIGNDAGALTEQTIGAGEAPAIAVGSQRVSRNWLAQNTGAVGAVDLSFDTTGLTFTGGSDLNNFRLMVDEDGDGNYATGTPVFYKPASATGNRLNFTGITLANNASFTVITQGSLLLPAIWQGFTVSLQKNKATLTWKTSDEINVDHYTVEYSTDGNSFKPAGTVAAKNVPGVSTYSFAQENLPAGTRYYRIKRVDKDGQFQLSDVKSVRPGGLNTVLLKSNPITKGRLELNIDVSQNQEAAIRIVSISGKILVQQHTGLTTGSNAVTTNVSALAAGTYFLQVQLSNEIINKKFVRL